MTTTEVETAAGRLAGTHADGVHTFLGVPYAAPVSGARRFLPPEPPEPWTGVRPATAYGPPSIQRPSVPGGDRVGHLFGGGPDVAMDEECLVLNVWTPATTGSRPVMVWFHGGGFSQGSAGDDVYAGAHLARTHDVVVVSVNHRLGIFGFLDLESVLGEDWHGSANAGLLDLVRSLEWVRENIGAFGGDPGAVTLFGESGGGGKVAALLAMPPAAGLFHRAVIQSGPPFQFRDPTKSEEITDRTLHHLGLSPATAKGLFDLPARDLFAVQDALGAGGGPSEGGMSFAPTVGSAVLPDYPETALAAGASADVPLIIGTNLDEARFMLMMLAAAGSPSGPALTDAELLDRLAVGCDGGAEGLVAHYRDAYPELGNFDLLLRIESEQFRIRSLRLVDARARAARAPAFVYLFTWVWPARAPFGAFHGLDIPLVFGNLQVARSLSGSTEAARVSAALGQRWTSFAATGTPVGTDGVVWPAYTAPNRHTLIVDDPLAVEADPYSLDRQAWDRVGTGPSTRPWARVLV